MTLILAALFIFAWYLKTQVSDVAFQEGACRFSQTFHLYCPGCGGTRSVKHLLHFDLVRSFLSHPIPIYAGILLLRIWVALLHNALFCRQPSGTNPAPGSDQIREEGAGNKEAAGKLGAAIRHKPLETFLSMGNVDHPRRRDRLLYSKERGAGRLQMGLPRRYGRLLVSTLRDGIRIASSLTVEQSKNQQRGEIQVKNVKLPRCCLLSQSRGNKNAITFFSP